MEIDYNALVETINYQLTEIMNESYNYYKGYTVYVADSQQYIRTSTINPKAIYIVIKFGSGEVTFGQKVVPLSITAMGEGNKLDVCRNLLTTFANKYNLTKTEDGGISQFYQTPNIIENFNTVGDSFRSLLGMNGTLLLTGNANYYDLYCSYQDETHRGDFPGFDEENWGRDVFLNAKGNGTYHFVKANGIMTLNGEEISQSDYEKLGLVWPTADNADFTITVTTEQEKTPIIKCTFGASINLDSQVFFGNQNFSKSVAKTGTITIAASSYLLTDSPFMNKLLAIMTKTTQVAPKGIDTKFYLTIKFRNGMKLNDVFKIAGPIADQNIGEIPVLNCTFTN